jgi:hypothetical protein
MRVSRSLCRLHNPSQNCGSKIRQHLNKSEYCNVRYAVDSKSHWLISAPVIFVDVMEPHRLCSKYHLFRTLAWQGPFHFAKMYSLVFRSISFTPLPHLFKCSTCSTAVLVWCVCVCALLDDIKHIFCTCITDQIRSTCILIIKFIIWRIQKCLLNFVLFLLKTS